MKHVNFTDKLNKNNKKEVYLIDCADIEKMICDAYGFTEYNLVYTEELQNDSAKIINVSDIADEFYVKYRLPEINKCIETYKGKECIQSYQTSFFLQHMCVLGIIPPGKYVINVSW